MIVTINTDASFSQKHQRGSFAFWIVSDRFKLLKSGLLRRQVSSPQIAEFRCIINAFHVLLNEDVSDVHKIIVNTDCLNVIHLIKGDKENIRRYRLASWGSNLVSTLEQMLIAKRLNPSIIEMRHVKAHTDNTDARSYVNDWCDREAKRHLGLWIEKAS